MFAKNLKKIRLSMKLSQEKFGSRLNVAQSTVGMWETGKRTPKLDEISRIAEKLNITVGHLLNQGRQKLEIIKNEVHIDGQKIKELDESDINSIINYIHNLQAAKGAPLQIPEKIRKLKPAKNVLIIDDEQEMCETLYSFLAPHNYRVFLTFNGEMALEYFDEVKPDIVLLDLSLPDMDGIDVLKIIRKISKVPVLIITAHPENIADIHLQNLDINGYLEKPLSLKQVLNTLKQIVGE